MASVSLKMTHNDSGPIRTKPRRKKRAVRKRDAAAGRRDRISAEELCAKSGLTDRRHRQIAEMGYFPPPIDGIYQRGLVMDGLLKYYREIEQRARGTKDAIAQEDLKERKRENAVADGLLVLKSAVAEELKKSLTPIKDILRTKLENELPVAMSGMNVPENRIVGRRVFDDVCDRIAKVFARWKV